MKKVLMILCALCVGFAYADNVPENKIVSSKEYVDSQLVDKQPVFGANENNVAVFTDDPGVITPKPVTETLTGNGVSNTDLPTVSAVNSGLNTKQNEIGRPIVPSEYTQLEYIETTGTQYIDTNIPINTLINPTIETTFQMLSSGDSDWFGTYNINNGGTIMYDIDTNGTTWIRFGTSGSRSFTWQTGKNASNLVFISLQTLKISGANTVQIYVDDELIATSTISSASFTDPKSILIGRGRTGLAGSSRWAGFKIMNNSDVLFNGIPVLRNSDGVVGMYDTVTNTFFTNAGSGTFIAGLVVSGITGAVVTYTETPGELGAKGIYQESGTYATQMDNLIDAGTFNEALRTGLESEFVCANRPDAYDPVSGNCWLWEINSIGVLPSGYTELEYIERNSPYAYIDTGVYPTANFEMYVDGMISSGPYNSKFFGTTTDSISVNCYSSTVFSSRISNISSNGGISIPGLNSKFHIGISPQWVLNYNGTYRTLNRPYSPSGTFTLFYSGSNVRGRIYNAQLYDGDILTFDGIPARRNSDNVVGMYDKVSGTFFTNAGTGTFIAGPEITYLPQNQ